ncbi:prepilin-type N-terminal cleavage/methylation domain-containing protein, partial [Candidatus Saccharibacteria bacterium]|nr:prepilin-type N-terminal cleavage/methylation domain-containing protein [Candidatus Saccharibacteria bacterium]
MLKSLTLISKNRQPGFTIVELLIVIVVIGILAAISIISYGGLQQRARDTVRKNDLAQLSKTIKLYSVDKGDYVEAGCGASGNGWLSSDYDGAGPLLSNNQCLLDGGYLSKVLKDPFGLETCGGLTCYAYMKGSCPGGQYLYAHLESLPQTAT